MSPEQKIVQYLNEAHASELALTRVLQSQIAMTPRGSYRSALETHLSETQDHARRVERRLSELGEGRSTLQSVVGFAEGIVGQALALGKTPFDLVRGKGGAREGAQERQGRRRDRGAGDRDLHVDRAPGQGPGDEQDRAARGLDPRRRGEDARARAARDPEADLGRDRRQVLRRRDHGRRRDRQARGQGDQAGRPPDPQGPGRRPGRGPGQGCRRVRERPRDRALRRADRRRDRRPAAALSQVDLAKVDSYERRHENRTTVLEPHLLAARQRAVAGL